MIAFNSWEELVDGDIYYVDSNPTVLIELRKTDIGGMWINSITKYVYNDHIGLNDSYLLTFLKHRNGKEEKWIDPRIIKARKEWGMEANKVFL